MRVFLFRASLAGKEHLKMVPVQWPCNVLRPIRIKRYQKATCTHRGIYFFQRVRKKKLPFTVAQEYLPAGQ